MKAGTVRAIAVYQRRCQRIILDHDQRLEKVAAAAGAVRRALDLGERGIAMPLIVSCSACSCFSQSTTTASVSTLTRSGSVLMNRPTMRSMPASSPGRPATVVPNIAGFMAALVAALWAYDGWNDLNMVGGEMKNPGRNIPIALIAGVATVGVLYMLMECGRAVRAARKCDCRFTASRL